MKKKIFIGIGVVLALIVITIGYFVVTDLNQESKLENELIEISDMVNEDNVDIDAVYERLNSTVTTGDYKVVEIAFKTYLKDNFDNTLKIAEILEDEKLVNILTPENYLNDGKDFIKTKEYITTTKTNLEKYKQSYIEFFTEEKAMSYIKDKGLDDYYIDLYKDSYVGDIENESSEDIKVVEESIDDIIEILNVSEEVINFLIENKDSWNIEGNNIVFSNDELSNKYDSLLDKLKKKKKNGHKSY